jgi:LysR family transcriptional regulator, glycine cleavage system transcriptional activator
VLLLPSTDALRCFVSAARLLNFRKAARTVSVTPAAFGQRIRHLEEDLGVALFKRTTRSVVLTEAGAALLPYADRCIAAATDCARAARGDVGPQPVDFTIGTRHELGVSWILPQLDQLARERPWMHTHLYFGSGPDLLHHVRTLQIDCGITSTRFMDPKLDSIRLHREDYVFVGARELLKRVPFTRFEHAARHVLLDISAELPLFRYWRDAPTASDRVVFARYTWLGAIAAIRLRALAGAGVAVLPEYLVRKDIADGRLRVILPRVVPLHDYFRLVFRADSPNRALLDALAASLAKAPLR